MVQMEDLARHSLRGQRAEGHQGGMGELQEGPAAGPSWRGAVMSEDDGNDRMKRGRTAPKNQGPPMKAGPSGAFCLRPRTGARAIGGMPMIMASAVNSATGRKAHRPAVRVQPGAFPKLGQAAHAESPTSTELGRRPRHAHDGASEATAREACVGSDRQFI